MKMILQRERERRINSDLLHKFMYSFLIKSVYSFGIDIVNIETIRLQNKKTSFGKGNMIGFIMS